MFEWYIFRNQNNQIVYIEEDEIFDLNTDTYYVNDNGQKIRMIDEDKMIVEIDGEEYKCIGYKSIPNC